MMADVVLIVSLLMVLAGAAIAWGLGQPGAAWSMFLDVLIIGSAYLLAAWRMRA